jgi:hypothetical protein
MRSWASATTRMTLRYARDHPEAISNECLAAQLATGDAQRAGGAAGPVARRAGAALGPAALGSRAHGRALAVGALGAGRALAVGSIQKVATGKKAVTPALALRVARFALPWPEFGDQTSALRIASRRILRRTCE